MIVVDMIFASWRRSHRTMGGVCVTLGEKPLAVHQTGRFFIVWWSLSGHLFFNHAAVNRSASDG
jgi:hypothetical protein